MWFDFIFSARTSMQSLMVVLRNNTGIQFDGLLKLSQVVAVCGHLQLKTFHLDVRGIPSVIPMGAFTIQLVHIPHLRIVTNRATFTWNGQTHELHLKLMRHARQRHAVEHIICATRHMVKRLHLDLSALRPYEVEISPG